MEDAESARPEQDRRERARTSKQQRATGIVQALIENPARAARMLTRDLDAGGDPNVIYGLLDAAEMIVQLRGIDLGPQVQALRKALNRRLGRTPED